MISPQSCTATTFVQRTMPVSMSTDTSATCTPPNLDEMPRFFRFRLFGRPGAGCRVRHPCRPAQASFQDQLLSRPLSRTLPFSRVRSFAWSRASSRVSRADPPAPQPPPERRRGLRRTGRAAARAGRLPVRALAELERDVPRLQPEQLGDAIAVTVR